MTGCESKWSIPADTVWMILRLYFIMVVSSLSLYITAGAHVYSEYILARILEIWEIDKRNNQSRTLP